MKIANEKNYVNLNVQLESDETLPSFGDALVGVKVHSNGYSGENQIWASKKGLQEFAESIINLEKSRKGEAVLKSISPGELTLRIFSYDSTGHMAIEGEMGCFVTGEVNFNHRITFGFCIEPEYLVKLAKEKWVNRKNA